MSSKLFWRRRRAKLVLNEPDPVYNVIYLGNVITPMAKGEGCFDKALALIWKTYCANKARQVQQARSGSTGGGPAAQNDIAMRLVIARSGLKAYTKAQGLTEYWAHRITFCTDPPGYPRIFVWIYKHEGKRMKPELRCHAALAKRPEQPQCMARQLSEKVSAALAEYRREKLARQNTRATTATLHGTSGQLPARKAMLSTGTANFRPPMTRSKSAPRLQSIIEDFEEEEEEDDDDDSRAIGDGSSTGSSFSKGSHWSRNGHGVTYDIARAPYDDIMARYNCATVGRSAFSSRASSLSGAECHDTYHDSPNDLVNLSTVDFNDETNTTNYPHPHPYLTPSDETDHSASTRIVHSFTASDIDKQMSANDKGHFFCQLSPQSTLSSEQEDAHVSSIESNGPPLSSTTISNLGSYEEGGYGTEPERPLQPCGTSPSSSSVISVQPDDSCHSRSRQSEDTCHRRSEQSGSRVPYTTSSPVVSGVFAAKPVRVISSEANQAINTYRQNLTYSHSGSDRYQNPDTGKLHDASVIIPTQQMHQLSLARTPASLDNVTGSGTAEIHLDQPEELSPTTLTPPIMSRAFHDTGDDSKQRVRGARHSQQHSANNADAISDESGYHDDKSSESDPEPVSSACSNSSAASADVVAKKATSLSIKSDPSQRRVVTQFDKETASTNGHYHGVTYEDEESELVTYL